MIPKQIDEDEWMAGMVDGDGCVMLHTKTCSSTDIGYKVEPEVTVAQSYVGGLLDSEGSVRLRVQKRTDRETEHQLQPHVQIAQDSHYDAFEQLIESYCTQHSVGYSTRMVENSGNRDDTLRFSVYGQQNTRAFLEPLRSKCIIKSPQIEILLNEIFPLLEEQRHLEKHGMLEVMAWKELLDSYKGGNRGKYSVSYFEELWDIGFDVESVDMEKYINGVDE